MKKSPPVPIAWRPQVDKKLAQPPMQTKKVIKKEEKKMTSKGTRT
jgi:hypothetical protein